jgi:ketosteroid isomerase-like protein
VTLTHQEIFERYLRAGAINRDSDAIAELFTVDGVYEAPLVPDGHRLPNRLAGREAIRAGIGAYHRDPVDFGAVDLARSRYVRHETREPDTFFAEIDTVLERGRMSLVWIFRVRDDRIALFRDYFAAPPD